MPSLRQPLKVSLRIRPKVVTWPLRSAARATCPASLLWSHASATRRDNLCYCSAAFWLVANNFCRLSSPMMALYPARCVSEPFTKQFMCWWLKYGQNHFCSNFYSDDIIMSQFCTCNNSWLVACAKLWHDIVIIFHVRVCGTGNKPSPELLIVDPVHWRINASPSLGELTHWGRGKMDSILQTTFSNTFSSMKMFAIPYFVPKGTINNIPALDQIMPWRRPGDKPLSEPMMARLPTHICVTQPQWVKDQSHDHVIQNIVIVFVHVVFIGGYWHGRPRWRLPPRPHWQHPGCHCWDGNRQTRSVLQMDSVLRMWHSKCHTISWGLIGHFEWRHLHKVVMQITDGYFI